MTLPSSLYGGAQSPHHHSKGEMARSEFTYLHIFKRKVVKPIINIMDLM